MTHPPQPPQGTPEDSTGRWMPPAAGQPAQGVPGAGPTPTPGPPPTPGMHPSQGYGHPTGPLLPRVPLPPQQPAGGSLWLGILLGIITAIAPSLLIFAFAQSDFADVLGVIWLLGLVGGFIAGLVLVAIRKTRLTGAGVLTLYGLLPIIGGGVCVALLATG